MKFETWRDENGKRIFSVPVAIVVGFAAAMLADEVFNIGETVAVGIVFVVMVWAGTRPIAEGEQGDRLTRAAFYASLAVLAALFAYSFL